MAITIDAVVTTGSLWLPGSEPSERIASAAARFVAITIHAVVTTGAALNVYRRRSVGFVGKCVMVGACRLDCYSMQPRIR